MTVTNQLEHIITYGLERVRAQTYLASLRGLNNLKQQRWAVKGAIVKHHRLYKCHGDVVVRYFQQIHILQQLLRHTMCVFVLLSGNAENVNEVVVEIRHKGLLYRVLNKFFTLCHFCLYLHQLLLLGINVILLECA